MVLRFYEDDCRVCIKNKKCVVYDDNGQVIGGCGCKMPEKAYVPFESCSEGNWGPIIWNKKKYKDFREKYPIDIKIIYKNNNNNNGE